MSKRRRNVNPTAPIKPEEVQDVEYEEIEDLETEVESEVAAEAPKAPEEEKKGFFNTVKGGVKKAGGIMLGVLIGVGGSLAVGYLMSRDDHPAELEEGDVEYYDFGDNEEKSEEGDYPGD